MKMIISPAGYLVNHTEGLAGIHGLAYDYILAGNGLYLRAKNDLLAVTVCIAPQEVRGLAPVEDSVQLLHGKIPIELLQLAISVMCTKPATEQYLAITWEGGYSIKTPVQNQHSLAVHYETVPNTILEMHSHTDGVPPDFSSIDDRDEKGFQIYGVVGKLRELCPEVNLRCGIYGYMCPIAKEEVFL
jgi:hypothetical protein